MDLMLDNNIILDHILDRQPHAETSRLVCLLGITGEATTYISVNMFTDIYYILRKAVGSQRAQEMIQNDLSFLEYVGITADDAATALSRAWADLEDCMVAQCAERIAADYIITRNAKDFTASTVEAISPEELFSRLEANGFAYEEIIF